MSNKGLRVAALVLQVLDYLDLRRLWNSNKALRSQFFGFAIEIEGKELFILSTDFFEKLYKTHWFPAAIPSYQNTAELPRLLMASDCIVEAAYTVRSLGIDNVRTLADIAMANGRLEAVHLLPLAREVMDEMRSAGPGLSIPRISLELYRACNMWGQISLFNPGMGSPIAVSLMVSNTCHYILNTLIEALIARSEVVIDWLAEKLPSLIQQYRFYFGVSLASHLGGLEAQAGFASRWGYAPAISLVDFLLALKK